MSKEYSDEALLAIGRAVVESPDVSALDDSALAAIAHLKMRSRADHRRRPPMLWLSRGFLIAGRTHVIKGKDNSFKTFSTLGICYSFARGELWAELERPDIAGETVSRYGFKPEGALNCVYVCLEGADEAETERLPALDAAAGLTEDWEVDAVPLFTMEELPAGPFSDFAKNMILFLESQGFAPLDRCAPAVPGSNFRPLHILALDTLSRLIGHYPGQLKENDNDSAAAIAVQFDKINAHFGSASIIVAHIGKSGTATRGASGLEANAPCRFLIELEEELVKISCEKMKGAPAWPYALHFRRESVSFPVRIYDVGGIVTGTETRTSLVFRRVPSPGSASAPEKGVSRSRVLSMLQKVTEAGGPIFTWRLINEMIAADIWDLTGDSVIPGLDPVRGEELRAASTDEKGRAALHRAYGQRLRDGVMKRRGKAPGPLADLLLSSPDGPLKDWVWRPQSGAEAGAVAGAADLPDGI